MGKYLFQRFLILTFILSTTIGVTGLWIPGFYTTHYDNVRVIKNTECRHYQADNSTSDKSLGRYVKFEYLDRDGIKRTDDDFWAYNNDLDHSCSKSYYNLIKNHQYEDPKGWLIAIMIILSLLSGFLIMPVCIEEMDVRHDYDTDDEKDIGFFRLNVFYYWKIFLGYPAQEVKEYCENLANDIDNTSKYNYHIKYYWQMNDELNQYIKGKKQQSEINVVENK